MLGLILPAVGIADVDHRFEDGVPSVGVFECGVGEHAAIPADVLDAASWIVSVFEPVAGAFCDVEFAVWIIGKAMLAGLVMAAGAVHFAVVLGHVEVDGPGAEGGGVASCGRS